MHMFDEGSEGYRHAHYGDFLEAVAKYHSKEQAALWWKAMFVEDLKAGKMRWRRWVLGTITQDVKKPWASQQEFDVWWKAFSEPDRFGQRNPAYEMAKQFVPEIE